MTEKHLVRLQKALLEGRIDYETYEQMKADYLATAERPSSSSGATHSGHSAVNLDQAIQAQRAGDHAGALVQFDAVLAKEKSVRALVGRAECLTALGRIDEALTAYEDALQLDPASELALAGRAVLLLQQGKPGEVSQALDQWVTACPSSAVARECRGHHFRQLKDHDRAIVDYTECLRLDPRRVGVYSGRAWSYFVKEDASNAMADCTKALHLKSRDLTALRTRGWVYLRRGEYQRALADFNRCLKLDSTDPHSWYGRAVTLRQLAVASKDAAQFEAAQRDFEEAHRLEPNYQVPTAGGPTTPPPSPQQPPSPLPPSEAVPSVAAEDGQAVIRTGQGVAVEDLEPIPGHGLRWGRPLVHDGVQACGGLCDEGLGESRFGVVELVVDAGE